MNSISTLRGKGGAPTPMLQDNISCVAQKKDSLQVKVANGDGKIVIKSRQRTIPHRFKGQFLEDQQNQTETPWCHWGTNVSSTRYKDFHLG